MNLRRPDRLTLISIALVLAACGGDAGTADSSTTTAGQDAPATTSAADTTTTTGAADTTTTTASAAPAGGTGEATLTVGDQVYEFDNYYCRVGAENTRNENISFSSGAFGEVEGNRTQLDASIYDGSGQDRMDGDVIRTVTLMDVTDFSNPKVAWTADGGFHPDPVAFEFDGSTLRVETLFDDDRTDELEQIPGVLEAVCGQ